MSTKDEQNQNRKRRTFIIVQLVLVSKVIPRLTVEEVGIVASAGPAPTLVIPAVLVLDIQPFAGQVVVDPVAGVLLNVGIHDGDELAAVSSEALSHSDAVGELAGVPGEVLFPVCVLNVEPHHIHWDVMLVKLPSHGIYIILIIVIPPAEN